MTDDARSGGWVASMDQMKAAAVDWAHVIAAFFKALIDDEVPFTVATALAIGYQETMIGSVLAGGDDETTDDEEPDDG